MSAKVSGQAWELDIPHGSMLVLQAMADHADHNGENVFPSLRLIAWKTGYTERQVRRIVDELEKAGVLVPTETRSGFTTIYRIDLSKAPHKKPFEAVRGRPPLTRKPAVEPTENPCNNVTDAQKKPLTSTQKTPDICDKTPDICDKTPDICDTPIYKDARAEPSENRHIEPSDRTIITASPQTAPKTNPSPPPKPEKPAASSTACKHAGSPRGCRLPEDFVPSKESLEWAAAKCPAVNVDDVTEEFRDYWRGVPGRAGTKLDWEATWRNRVRDKAARIRPVTASPMKKTAWQQQVEKAHAETDQFMIDWREGRIPDIDTSRKMRIKLR